MSNIVFNCPECDAKVEAETAMAGMTMTCSDCSMHVNIPAGILEGDEVGDFVVKKKLGVGGMGEVWLAYQAAMDRQVALKILSPALIKDANFVNRFMSEVKVAAKLEHPNIVGAYYAGTEGNIHYLATSFVDGKEFGDLVKSEELSEKEILLLMRDIAEALDYAWKKFKILHRDIKPANIMVDKDRVAKLMDMGIAKSLSSEESSMTMTGVIVGTPNYMSPEQARGQSDIDSRTDIYAFGATMFELLSGQTPFKAPTPMGIITKHLTEPVPDIQEINPEISKQSSVFIQLLMSKDKYDRPKSWEAVIEDINLVAAGKYPNEVNIKDTKSKVPLIIGIVASLVIIASLLIMSKQIINKVNERKSQKVTLSDNLDSTMTDSDFARITKNIEQKEPPKSTFNNKNDSNNNSVSAFESSPVETTDVIKEREGLWNYVVDYEKKNPNNLESIILKYQSVHKKYPNHKYGLIAQDKINEYKKQLSSIKLNKDIQVLISELKEKVKVLNDEKKYDQAALVFTSYNGEIAKETQEIRQELANGYLEKAQKIKETQRKIEELKNKIKDFRIRLERLVLEKKFGDATALLNINKTDELLYEECKIIFTQCSPALTILNDQDLIILQELRKSINKKITLRTKNNPMTGIIKEVENNIISLERLVGGGKIVNKIPVNTLLPETKRQIIKQVNPLANKIIAFTELQNNENFVEMMLDETPILRNLFPTKYADFLAKNQTKQNAIIEEKKQAEQQRLKQEKLEKDYAKAIQEIKDILAKVNCHLESSQEDMKRNMFSSKLSGEDVRGLMSSIEELSVKYKHLDESKIRNEISQVITLHKVLQRHPMANQTNNHKYDNFADRKKDRNNRDFNDKGRDFNEHKNDISPFQKSIDMTGDITKDTKTIFSKVNSTLDTPNMSLASKLQETNLSIEEKEEVLDCIKSLQQMDFSNNIKEKRKLKILAGLLRTSLMKRAHRDFR